MSFGAAAAVAVADLGVGSSRVERLTNGTGVAVARPKNTPRPRGGILTVHEFFGLKERDVALAERLADETGCVVYAVDVFQGEGCSLVPVAIYLALKHALVGGGWGVQALAAARERMRREENLDVDAVLGFCVGGGAALRFCAAAHEPVGACCVFYGKPVGGAEAASLHGTAVWAAYGGKDAQFPASDVDAFETALGEAGVERQVERYADEGHAFVRDASVIDVPGPAHDAWRSAVAFIAARLA